MSDAPLAIILAGGASRRFGGDKSRAIINNRTLLEEVASQLDRAGFSVMVSMGPNDSARGRWSVIRDGDSHRGPWHAVASIFHKCPVNRFLLAACDMPLIQPTVLRLLWESATIEHGACLVDVKGGINPLPAVYTRSMWKESCDRLRPESAGLKDVWRTARDVYIPWNRWMRLDPSAQTLCNVNYLTDLVSATRFRRGR